MSLLRTVARTMLASYFVYNGIRTVREPQELVPATQPLADTIVPLVQKVAPPQVVELVPTDTVTLVRANGIAQIVGGIALATGKARRLGAVILAGTIAPQTLTRHAFWTAKDPVEKEAQLQGFLAGVALAGSVLLASLDTEGKPSLAWRAAATTDRGRKAVDRARKRVQQ